MIITKIKEVDKELTDLVANLKNYSKQIVFTEIAEFRIGDEEIDIPYDDINCHGLYLFEIKNQYNFNNFKDWLEDIRTRWEDKRYKFHFTPNFKKKRIKAHSSFEDYIPFYLGKHTCLKNRIGLHLNMSMKTNTGGMKLLARDNIKDEIFKVSVFKLPVVHYGVISPILERKLRDRFNPLIGQ